MSEEGADQVKEKEHGGERPAAGWQVCLGPMPVSSSYTANGRRSRGRVHGASRCLGASCTAKVVKLSVRRASRRLSSRGSGTRVCRRSSSSTLSASQARAVLENSGRQTSLTYVAPALAIHFNSLLKSCRKLRAPGDGDQSRERSFVIRATGTGFSVCFGLRATLPASLQGVASLHLSKPKTERTRSFTSPVSAHALRRPPTPPRLPLAAVLGLSAARQPLYRAISINFPNIVAQAHMSYSIRWFCDSLLYLQPARPLARSQP